VNARAPLLRGVAALASVGLLAALVVATGAAPMIDALRRVAPSVPSLVAIELAVVALNALALSALYRASGAPPPRRALWRATFLANALAATLPFGRLVAEAWKAARLRRWSGAHTASAAAVGLQSSLLLANAAIAVAGLVGVSLRCGRAWPTLAVGGLAVASTLLGGGLVAAGRLRAGRWLGDRMRAAAAHGPLFDAAFARVYGGIASATSFECAARALQLAQVTILLRATGHAAGLVDALATHGVVLTGAALGDALPAQVGATDAMLAVAATQLGLPTADALAITFGLHGAQVCAGLAGAALAMIQHDAPTADERDGDA
jgi:Lysylphosphatidylglycerol synthase TM region